jgi:hypothetical protein
MSVGVAAGAATSGSELPPRHTTWSIPPRRRKKKQNRRISAREYNEIEQRTEQRREISRRAQARTCDGESRSGREEQSGRRPPLLCSPGLPACFLYTLPPLPPPIPAADGDRVQPPDSAHGSRVQWRHDTRGFEVVLFAARHARVLIGGGGPGRAVSRRERPWDGVSVSPPFRSMLRS